MSRLRASRRGLDPVAGRATYFFLGLAAAAAVLALLLPPALANEVRFVSCGTSFSATIVYEKVNSGTSPLSPTPASATVYVP